ncbi:hypothetical protein ATANTOWER_023105 [Ataeniobius toweri]|uniref:Uncharacterized protein n=1 Tax=Ataeniobius toweri TaxID=208326 RepID=A0ABU7A7S5_9TELE|nr:hypothetical protein [Ataeniobius toweri]
MTPVSRTKGFVHGSRTLHLRHRRAPSMPHNDLTAFSHCLEKRLQMYRTDDISCLHPTAATLCSLLCWTTCLLNIGPFARCWTLPGLPAFSAILYPRTVRYYKSQRPLRLIGQGRRSSEATVHYITEYEMAHHLLFTLETGPATEAHHSGEEVPRGFHLFSSLANEKEKFMKEVSGIRRPEISLCRSKT